VNGADCSAPPLAQVKRRRAANCRRALNVLQENLVRPQSRAVFDKKAGEAVFLKLAMKQPLGRDPRGLWRLRTKSRPSIFTSSTDALPPPPASGRTIWISGAVIAPRLGYRAPSVNGPRTDSAAEPHLSSIQSAIRTRPWRRWGASKRFENKSLETKLETVPLAAEQFA